MAPQPSQDHPETPSLPARTAQARYQVGTLAYSRGGLALVMFWLLGGDFFFQLMESLTPALIPLQLRWAGASDTLIGTLSGSLGAALGFFLYPIAGVQSDRHRGRLGRRRPFLIWCIPPAMLSLVLLGAAKPAGDFLYRIFASLGGAGVTAAGCTIVWIGVCATVFLVFNVYINQMHVCLFADVIPQQVLGKYVGVSRAVGALGNLAFNRWVLGWAEAYTFHVYLLIALLFAGTFALLIWQVKEGDYPPPPPKQGRGGWAAIKSYLQECFTHPFYLNFYCLSFFFWASLVPLSFVVFFGTTSGQPGYAPTLGLPLQEFGQVKGWTFIIQIPVFFVVGFLADWFHPLRVAILGLLLASLSYFACFWFIRDARSLLLWWSVNQGSLAIYLGAIIALSPRLLPRARYGQFISANQTFGFIPLVIGPPLCGLLLESIRDYRYTFVLCGGCTLIAFIASITLYLQWRKLGGDRDCSPP